MLTTQALKTLLDKKFAIDFSRPLFEQLASLELVALVDYLESQLKIHIEALEVDRENFSSLESLTQFVNAKS